ncbi:phosphatase PAP2 family protein [Streptomyces bambusae]|uniref:phosphatase PAP2 family protein n=1 Tax=Streptomyces bambusae TaxID=1550616 RepID=UPI001CFEEEB9|nr:phosphatase PAP2 family protein [Streptomyces bambusae]MCB5166682.1 phosphatase PAP2 family protein [Streptomyces bambusae]
MRSPAAPHWWTVIACAVPAAVLTVLVALAWPPLLRADRRLSEALHRDAVAHPATVRVNRVLSDWVWDPWTMRALALVLCGWLLVRGARRAALAVAVATAVSTAVSQGLKALLGRERPQWPDPVDSADYAAYPSGHAMTAAVVCALVLWGVPQGGVRPPGRIAVAVVVVSVLGVGWTRVYLGVHWPSDVLGGWLLGVALAAAAAAWAAAGRAPAGAAPVR